MESTVILVLGGTARSGDVVRRLRDRGHPVRVSVTRPSSRRLYPHLEPDRLHVGKRDRDALDDLVVRLAPDRIVDVTHPFAETISRNAMSVARERTIPYAYLERPSELPEEARGLRRLDGWDAAVRACTSFGSVLLTIGVNRLARFTEAHPGGTLYARVIPRPDSVRRARDSGVARERVIGLWPPVSTAINRALITTHDLDAIVSKDSGPDGGVPQKWEAARREGIPLLLVERPDVDYRRRFEAVEALLEWVSSPVPP